jgi:hypothetical protein
VCGLDDYDEEDAVGLRENAPWTAEDQLVKLGVDFARGEIGKPFTVSTAIFTLGRIPPQQRRWRRSCSKS